MDKHITSLQARPGRLLSVEQTLRPDARKHAHWNASRQAQKSCACCSFDRSLMSQGLARAARKARAPHWVGCAWQARLGLAAPLSPLDADRDFVLLGAAAMERLEAGGVARERRLCIRWAKVGRGGMWVAVLDQEPPPLLPECAGTPKWWGYTLSRGLASARQSKKGRPLFPSCQMGVRLGSHSMQQSGIGLKAAVHGASVAISPRLKAQPIPRPCDGSTWVIVRWTMYPHLHPTRSALVQVWCNTRLPSHPVGP
jgi:hypothetical protein